MAIATKARKSNGSRPTTKGEQIECSICGKTYVKAYIPKHLKMAHGITGGLTAMRKMNGGALVPYASPESVEKTNGKGEFHELRDFRVLQDSRGAMWLAERIR